MNKRFWSILAATALVMSGFQILPAMAATEVPEVVQIEDPAGDANFVNDQDVYWPPKEGTPLDHPAGDVAGPADGGSATDILKAWFSHTAETISIHIQTEAPPGTVSSTVYLGLRSNEGTGPENEAGDVFGCIRMVAVVAGTTPTYQGDDFATVDDTCNVPEPADAVATVEEGPDGTGITTITAPRSYSPLFADGQKMVGAYVVGRAYVGADGAGAAGVQADNTKRGTDYQITAGGGSDPKPAPSGAGPSPTSSPTAGPNPEPSPTASPEPKKKKANKCKKKKGKAKKKCLKKQKKKKNQPKPDPSPTPTPSPSPSGSPTGAPPAGGSACPAYVPGDNGTGAETVIVDAGATAEKPLEVVIPTEAGVPVAAADTYINIQVDAAAADAGLYAGFLFEVYEDYDIYLEYPDGSVAAQAAGFNPFPFVPPNPALSTDGTGSGGHSEQGAEFLDGVRTADCGGYTLNVHSFLAEGGDKTLQLWLGEPTYDPPPPAALFGAPMHIL